MVLIADSGSTKCDWVLVSESARSQYKTVGFNPTFQGVEFIQQELGKSEMAVIKDEVNRVFFYGAGCGSVELNPIMQKALSTFFSKAEVVVKSDLAAAAYATFDGRSCISCILGTGANSCFFDGEKITEIIPSLGFILGDEGSGSYYGKKLLQAYLYKELPKDINAMFIAEYGELTKAEIVDRVYRKPRANVYLASFMKFFAKNSAHEWVQQAVREGMECFLRTHVCCYSNFRDVPVHFVGSVAHYFEEPLHEVASLLGIEVGVVVKQPVERLVGVHGN